MIPLILNGLLAELNALLENERCTIIFDTQFEEDNMPSYLCPLIILSVIESPDCQQLPGGATQQEWDINLKVYNLEPNPELQPDSGYSTGLIQIIDTIRQHFAKKIFLTTEYTDLITDYSFNQTYAGIKIAEKLKTANGILMGFAISYNTIAIDNTTMHTQLSDVVLEKLHQEPLSPYMTVDNNTLSIAQPLNSYVDFTITTNTWWKLTIPVSWLTANYLNGGLSKTVRLTATANTGASSRNTTVVLSRDGATSINISVTQAAIL